MLLCFLVIRLSSRHVHSLCQCHCNFICTDNYHSINKICICCDVDMDNTGMHITGCSVNGSCRLVSFHTLRTWNRPFTFTKCELDMKSSVKGKFLYSTVSSHRDCSWCKRTTLREHYVLRTITYKRFWEMDLTHVWSQQRPYYGTLYLTTSRRLPV